MATEDVRNSTETNASSNGRKRAQVDFRKYKMLLVLPFIMLPFLTLAFWALGGGKKVSDNGKITEKREGLNLDLPSANIKDDGKEDKLTFYEKAQQEEKNRRALVDDSLFRLRDKVTDPNKLDDIVANSPSQYDPTPKDPFTGLNTSPVHSQKYKDDTEYKIMNRLKQLQEVVNNPQQSYSHVEDSQVSEAGNSDVDRLEGMMKMMQDKKADDPEMGKLEGMLDKILDIQHPDLVKEKLKEKSIQQKSNAFPVYSVNEKGSTSLLTGDTNVKRVARNGFYSVEDVNKGGGDQNAVEAAVHETQTLVNGSIVKLRLMNDIYVGGRFIPKGNFLFGVASLEGERLNIEITSIRLNSSIIPVKLSVYDMDGLAGINIPGAITRDVAKQSVDNSLQNVELGSYNPSLAVQATTTGINAAKSLISRKVKLVKVTVKAGYRVLLWAKSNQGDN